MIQIKTNTVFVLFLASILIYIVKPSVSNSVLSMLLYPLVVSPICVLVTQGKEVSTKSYVLTLFNLKTFAYSIVIGGIFAVVAYMYSYLIVVHSVDITRYTAFIPVAVLYILLNPILQKICVNTFGDRLSLTQYAKILLSVAFLTTVQVFSTSLVINNWFLVEIRSFVGALVFVCTLSSLSLIASTQSR